MGKLRLKMSYWVAILLISTIIPLISNTYVTLSGTIQTILQYIQAFCIYILVKQLVQRKKASYKIISNLLVILTIIIIIIGIDSITMNQLADILNAVGMPIVQNGENRLSSLIGYPNALAAYISSILFLNINEYLHQEGKKKRICYKTVSFILITAILLTYSKAIFVILPITIIIYILSIKEQKKKAEIAQNILLSLMMSVFYLVLFEKITNANYHILIWPSFVGMIILNYIINWILENRKESIRFPSKKKVLLISSIMFFVCFTYIVVGLSIYDTYEVFTEAKESKYEAKVISHINGNTKYLLEFNLEAKAPRDIENTYTINVIERDKQNREINQTQIKFGTYKGTKEIELITKETTSER